MNRERVVPGLVLLVICCFLALQPGPAIGSTCPNGVACPSGTTFNSVVDQCQAELGPPMHLLRPESKVYPSGQLKAGVKVAGISHLFVNAL